MSLLEEFGIFAYFLQLICGRIETLKIKEEKFSPKLQFQVTNSQLWLMHFLERTLIHIMPSKSLYLFEEKLYRHCRNVEYNSLSLDEIESQLCIGDFRKENFKGCSKLACKLWTWVKLFISFIQERSESWCKKYFSGAVIIASNTKKNGILYLLSLTIHSV